MPIKTSALPFRKPSEQERQGLHNKISKAYEKTNQKYLDNIVGNLAFHFARSGNEVEAGVQEKEFHGITRTFFRLEEIGEYDERHQGIMPAQLEEGHEILSPQRMGLIKDLIRHLVSTAKSIKIYPDGSQLITISSVGLEGFLLSIFDEVDTLTFSEYRDKLYLNDFILDSKNYGSAVDELLVLMRDHYIKTITFCKGVTIKDIEVILRNMDKAFDGCFTDKSYWNNFLKGNNITKVAIAQRILQSTQREKVCQPDTTVYEKVKLTPQSTGNFKDFFRYLHTAIENYKLYPSGSQLVVQHMRFLDRLIKDILQNVSVLNLAVAEEMILINGEPVHNRVFGPSALNFTKIIRTYLLRSISFSRGITKEEIQLFVEVISKTDLDEVKERTLKDWEVILEQKGIANIRIGDIPFISSTEVSQADLLKDSAIMQSETEVSSKTSDSSIIIPVPVKDESTIIKLDTLIKEAPDKLLDDESLRIAEILLYNNEDEKFEQFYQRFLQNFTSKRAEIRTQVNVAYQKLLKGLSKDLKSLLMAKTLNVIIMELASENNQLAYNALFNSVVKHVAYYLQNKEYQNLKDIVVAVVKGNPDKEITKGGPEKLLDIIRENPQYLGIIRELSSSESHVRNTIQDIFLAFDLLIIPEMLNVVRNYGQKLASEMTAIADIINKTGLKAHQYIINELKTNSDPVQIKPILEMAHLLEIEGIEYAVARFIKGYLSEDALEAICKLDKDKCLGILIPLLDDKNSSLVISILIRLSELKYREIVIPVINLLRNSGNMEIQKEACKTLVQMQAEEAVPVLSKILLTKKFLGLIGGSAYDDLRRTAAWALGEVKTPEAKKALLSVANDRSSRIRSMVKLSLSNYTD